MLIAASLVYYAHHHRLSVAINNIITHRLARLSILIECVLVSLAKWHDNEQQFLIF